jgi:type II secretory pathway pseudopilin PulG
MPLALVLVGVSAAALAPVLAQQKPDKKLQQAQQQELQTLLRVADAVSAGQPAPSDIQMSLDTDFLKAQEGRTYVPFTLSFDRTELASKSISLYIRVVDKAKAAAAATGAAKKETNPERDANQDKKAAPAYAYQGVYFIDLKAPGADSRYRISRAFAVPGGTYDVLIVLKERPPVGSKDKNAVYKIGVLRQDVTVPDYWSGELDTSSIILADKVDALTAPLSPQEQIEQPYTIGMTQIVPAISTKFSKKGELSLVLLIYNTQLDSNKKPDVQVEYDFYRKVPTEPNGEKFFNKTQPQVFNASTLPPQFDPNLGHQLVAGQAIPLESFPEGEYRLQIKVADKLSGKNITKNVLFSVGA